MINDWILQLDSNHKFTSGKPCPITKISLAIHVGVRVIQRSGGTWPTDDLTDGLPAHGDHRKLKQRLHPKL